MATTFKERLEKQKLNNINKGGTTMRKRIMSIISIIVMVCLVTACGAKETPAKPTTAESSSSSVSTENITTVPQNSAQSDVSTEPDEIEENVEASNNGDTTLELQSQTFDNYYDFSPFFSNLTKDYKKIIIHSFEQNSDSSFTLTFTYSNEGHFYIIIGPIHETAYDDDDLKHFTYDENLTLTLDSGDLIKFYYR